MKTSFALLFRSFSLRAAVLGMGLAALAFCFCALPAQAQRPATTADTTTCRFAPDRSLKLDSRTMVDPDAPVMGNPDADLTLVEFFDPNCPHCARFHPIIKRVMQKYGDRVQLYLYPFPLWRYSLPQIEAMLLAAQKGKYYDMIDWQMKHRYRGGTSRARLAMTADSLGLDRAAFAQALQEKDMRPKVMKLYRKARRAGVKRTPTLALGKRVVAPRSRSVKCIGRLIERERAEQK